MPGKNNIPKVTLDRKQCIFCNLCNEVAEEVFCEKGQKSAVRENADLSDESILEKVRLAVSACPVHAIKITE